MKQLLKNDLIWRPAVAVLVLVLAAVLHFILNIFAQNQIYTPLRSSSVQLSQNAAVWLKEKGDLAGTLAEDPRIQAAFAAPNWQQAIVPIRRTLYEFSYLNEIRFAYIVNPQQQSAVLRTAGAPNLPLAIFDLLMQDGAQQGSLLVDIGERPYLLMIARLPGEMNGYSGYLEPLEQALRTMRPPFISSPFEFSYGLLRTRGDDKVAGVMNLNVPQLIVLDPAESALPLTTETATEGQYLTPTGEMVTSIQPVRAMAGWRTITQVDAAAAASQMDLFKLIIKVVAGLIILALIVVPGKGAYAKFLRKYKILPGGNDVMSDGKDIGDIDDALGAALAVAGMTSPDSSGIADNERARAVFEKTRETLKKDKAKFYGSKRQQSEDDGELSENIIMYLIRRAINENRMVLLYQPVFDSTTNQPVMYEVFLRLLDEDGAQVPPGKFIPIAEQHNIMGDLDGAVINNVLKTFFLSGQTPPAPLSINLSGDTFDSIDYLHNLLKYTSDGIVNPNMLHFELRSKEILKDRRAMDFIRECRDMGFKFAMDYFGGGPQVLKAAKALRFSYCKLDAFRFKNIAKDKALQKELVQLAVTAKQLKLRLILERLENPALEKLARKVGIPHLQGYGLAEPQAVFTKEISPKVASQPVVATVAESAPAPASPAESTESDEAANAEVLATDPSAAPGHNDQPAQPAQT